MRQMSVIVRPRRTDFPSAMYVQLAGRLRCEVIQVEVQGQAGQAGQGSNELRTSPTSLHIKRASLESLLAPFWRGTLLGAVGRGSASTTLQYIYVARDSTGPLSDPHPRPRPLVETVQTVGGFTKPLVANWFRCEIVQAFSLVVRGATWRPLRDPADPFLFK